MNTQAQQELDAMDRMGDYIENESLPENAEEVDDPRSEREDDESDERREADEDNDIDDGEREEVEEKQDATSLQEVKIPSYHKSCEGGRPGTAFCAA